MGKLITKLFGRREEPEQQETAPIRSREVIVGRFPAGWVTNDGTLHGEPPFLVRPHERRSD